VEVSLLKLLSLALLAAASLPAVTVYTQDFESGTTVPTGWTAPSGSLAVQASPNLSGNNFGFGANHLRNPGIGSPSIQFSITGLAAHTALSFSFDYVIWDSMDHPKTFSLTLDGVAVTGFPATVSNYFAPSGLFTGPGTLVSPEVIDFSNPGLGQNAQFRDQARRVATITVPHTASSATFVWTLGDNVTGGGDESWGIDNFVLADDNVAPSSGVPEPSTFALGGAALLYLLRRRR
jgi:uncharacterized protein (TIGR03382 family)